MRNIRSKILGASLGGLPNAVSRLVYSMAKPAALAEIAREIGARSTSIEAMAEAKAYQDLGNTEIGSYLNSQFTDQPKANLETLAALYATHPWVKICCSYLSTALAGIPLRVWTSSGYDKGKEILEPADDTAVGDLFRWVNPSQSPRGFIEDLTSWLILTGEAYVAYTDPAPGAPRGTPADMYVLLSPFVEKVSSSALGISGYRYQVGGDVAYFDASEIAYFSTFSPSGRWRGEGTVAAGIGTVATDKDLRQFNRNVLRQGVHLSGVLETDNEDLNRESAEVIRRSFESQYAGSSKAAKIAVLWGGLKFSPQTILQKDIMMLDQVSNNRDEIIALFGLKPELLTDKFANKATAETVRRMAYEDVILGRWGAQISADFNSTGLRRFGPNYRVKFDASAVPALQTSARERVTVGKDAVASGLMTINEVRVRMLNLERVDGIEGDVIFMNGIPAADALTANETAPMKGSALADLIDGVETSAAVCEIKAPVLSFQRSRLAAERRTEAAIRAVLRSMQKGVRAVNSRSVTRSEMLAEIEKVFLIDGRKTMIEDVSASLRHAIDKQIELELASLSAAGVVGAFDVKPFRAMKRLGLQEQRIRNMMGKSWGDLRGSLVEGLQGGETTAELNHRTSNFFGGMRKNAATVARTEVNTAINGAATDVALTAREQGVDVVSIWVTAQDSLVRHPPKADKNHRRAHGLTIVPGEEMFLVSGERLEFPGDSWNGATAGNTINCRCAVRNEVRKIKPVDNRGEV